MLYRVIGTFKFVAHLCSPFFQFVRCRDSRVDVLRFQCFPSLAHIRGQYGPHPRNRPTKLSQVGTCTFSAANGMSCCQQTCDTCDGTHAQARSSVRVRIRYGKFCVNFFVVYIYIYNNSPPSRPSCHNVALLDSDILVCTTLFLLQFLIPRLNACAASVA